MSVHQLKDGRWLCQYPKGRDTTRPTTNKKYFGRGHKAEREAHSFNASLGLGKKGEKETPFFVELCNTYYVAKSATLAKSTYEANTNKLRQIILPRIGHRMAHSLTPAALDAYVAERAQKVKLNTIHRELSDIRAILRWSVKRKLIARNPMEGFEFPKKDDARIQPPSKVEFEAILDCAAPHLKRAMLISYYTGLRPGKVELLSLTWDSINFADRTIMITSARKGGLPVRMVPLHHVLYDHLTKWYEADREDGLQHIIHYRGKKIEGLHIGWRAAKKRAGITRRIRLYDIRHRAITNMLEAGADLKSVSEIAGHASTALTAMVYQHCSTTLKRNAVDLLE